MGKSYISAEEMISVDIFNEITVSDNGKKYAYIKKTADWGKNEYLKELWTVEGRKAVKVCNGAFSVKFSKDGRLSYIRKAGKKNQIFVYDGEEVQITFKENGVSGFYCWNNEDDGFYFLACEENKKIKDRKENFGDYYFEDRDYNYPDLYSVNIKQSVKNNVIISKIPKDLRDEKKLDISEKIYSPGNININSFAVSDNYIYFSGSDSPDINDVENSEIYRLDLKTLLIKNYDISGVNSSLYISPDKKHLAFITNKKWMENPKLNILNFKTGKIKIQETPDTDFSILGWKEKGIYILTYEGVKNKIYRYDGKKPEKIFDENKSLIDAAVSQKEDIIFYGAGNSEPPEIYFNGKAVTNSGKIFSKRSHSVKKTIIWSASDGTEVEGVLSVPEDFDENKKYPLLLCVHGGPTWISRDYLNTAARIYPIESFTEKGFIVLEPNYRGSIGYGEKFKSLNFKNLGIGDYDDVISGADYLISLGYADSEKIGIMGWSQGGYISAFCSTYSKRFKAISVGAGISDWTDYYYMTDIHTFTNQYLGENPWNDPEIYKKTSPMSYIKNACTPTMIQHGKSDTRVPVNNAYKLYQGLKDMKVPVELVLFEDMSHSPDKPGIQRAIMNQNLIWFSHYILGESDENLMK